MSPTTPATKLKSVIESLKLTVSTTKQSAEVIDSLDQLNSTVKLLASAIRNLTYVSTINMLILRKSQTFGLMLIKD
jgi:hypothetical protein